MTNEETKQFYSEMGAVMEKYNLRGVVGLWFGHGEKGVMQLFDPTDTGVKIVTGELAKVLATWLNLHGEPTQEMSGLTDVDGVNN